ncbi:hypothetical protein HORIV_10030 [Vreelandella olivaria]|uniref:Uncharacterized protein n=1 Tax=Vreelandella olivaria TaxID=390919 RepID=A0ABN5WNX3_9GAMM|nr:hypothetical protein HORIV_10030 [Halomonas olivaria]
MLTRKAEGGVEYRFVGGPYQPEDYLVESEAGVAALDYTNGPAACAAAARRCRPSWARPLNFAR